METTTKISLKLAFLTGALLGSGAWADDVTLNIESWRNDDLTIWQTRIIPAFEAKHPGIKVILAPAEPVKAITLESQIFIGQFVTNWNAVLAALGLAIIPVLAL